MSYSRSKGRLIGCEHPWLHGLEMVAHLAQTIQFLEKNDSDMTQGFFLGNPIEKYYHPRRDDETDDALVLYLRPRNIGQRNYVSPRDNPSIPAMYHDQVETLSLVTIVNRWDIGPEHEYRNVVAYTIVVPVEKQQSLMPCSVLSATEYLQKLVGLGLVSAEQTVALDNFFKQRRVLSEQHVRAYIEANLNYRRKRPVFDDS